jgi:hypothetical protein
MTTISVTGTAELSAALKALGSDVSEAVTNAVNATGLELRGDIVKRIQRGPKSGRTYARRGITHQASAPGQAPATDTGRLVGSITFKMNTPTSVSVFSLLPYASYLEFGTFRIAPRPSWTPAALKVEPKFRKRLEAAIAGAIR